MSDKEVTGTIFDLDESAGVWFDMDGGGRVCMRTPPYDVMKKINKQVTKKQVVFKKVDGVPGRFEFEEIDDEKQNELFWDYSITAWENLFDSKGNAIACTKENKCLMMLRSP